MRWESTEKTILAYFPSQAEAVRALRSLREQGFARSRVDPVSSVPVRSVYGSPFTARIQAVEAGRSNVIPGEDLSANDIPEDQQVLTVVAALPHAWQAEQILKDHGALV